VPDSFVEFPLERAHHLARWQELVDDPELARWPGRVETDRLGRMIVSLIPALSHSFVRVIFFERFATSCLAKLSSHARLSLLMGSR
jgi:hypothetical protein